MNTTSLAVSVLALAGLGLSPSPAQAQEWEKLGSRVVQFHAEKDVIEVTAKEGKFDKIRFGVEDGDLMMFNVKVVFGDGQAWSPDTKFEFKEGSRSREIDLPGEARFIRRVEFEYKSRIRKGRATVNLWGHHAGGGGGEKERRWERLGSRDVSPRVEKDTIVVTAKEGVFDAIRLDVEGGDIILYDLRIVFGNGDPYSPKTRLHFKEGSMSQVIDLPGEARFIQKVEFAYEGIREGKGRATVHLFGRHAKGGVTARKDPKDRFPGWEHLGTRTVDFGADKDVIQVRGEGPFTAFKIEVDDGALEMFDIVVHFHNGQTVSPKTRLVFDDDTRSRDIDLPGKARIITKMEFFYKSIRSGQGKATIHVYGRK
ncbi:MAG: hypothetical protein HYY17_10090 [Planctomycetes bacterium]|nr:hypothetical protein [Planctomycetota bacterium]